MRQIRQVIVHCSDSGPSTTVADIRKWHTDPLPVGRGWKDIAYHWVIYPDGSAHPGRDEEEIGAHCQGDNLFSIGVCLVGGRGGICDFSQAQYDKLSILVAKWKEEYGFDNSAVYGHRDRPSAKDDKGNLLKTCPNFDVRKFFPLE